MKIYIVFGILCIGCCLSCSDRATAPTNSVPVSATVSCSYRESAESIDTVRQDFLAEATFVDNNGSFVNCDSVIFNGKAMVNTWNGNPTPGQYSSVTPIADPSQRPSPRVKIFNFLGRDLDLPFELAPRFGLRGIRLIDTFSISRGLNVSYATSITGAMFDMALTFNAGVSEAIVGSDGVNGTGSIMHREEDDGTISIAPEELKSCTPFRYYDLSITRSRQTLITQGGIKIGLQSTYQWSSYVYLVP